MNPTAPPGKGEGTGRGRAPHRAWRLSGRVQGVGFRWWTARTARSIGLRGTVRNLPDGRVEVHAAGPAEALDDLERRLERGPAAARVDRLEEIRPADELPAGFEIAG